MNDGDHSNGSITVIMGPMFSGKSTELCRILKRYEISHEGFVLFKPVKDNRYSDCEVVTHEDRRLPAKVVPIDASCRQIILDASKGVKVVGFDEVQFWEKGSGPAGPYKGARRAWQERLCNHAQPGLYRKALPQRG